MFSAVIMLLLLMHIVARRQALTTDIKILQFASGLTAKFYFFIFFGFFYFFSITFLIHRVMTDYVMPTLLR